MVNILWVRAGLWSRVLIYVLLISAAIFMVFWTIWFWAIRAGTAGGSGAIGPSSMSLRKVSPPNSKKIAQESLRNQRAAAKIGCTAPSALK